jgi:hypothetical protein
MTDATAQEQNQATQGRELSTLALLRTFGLLREFIIGAAGAAAWPPAASGKSLRRIDENIGRRNGDAWLITYIDLAVEPGLVPVSARLRSSISTVAVMPADRTMPGGTSSTCTRTGMRCARRTQVKIGLTVANP